MTSSSCASWCRILWMSFRIHHFEYKFLVFSTRFLVLNTKFIIFTHCVKVSEQQSHALVALVVAQLAPRITDVLQNASFLIKNSSFLIRNSSFSVIWIQNSSFFKHKIQNLRTFSISPTSSTPSLLRSMAAKLSFVLSNYHLHYKISHFSIRNHHFCSRRFSLHFLLKNLHL